MTKKIEQCYCFKFVLKAWRFSIQWLLVRVLGPWLRPRNHVSQCYHNGSMQHFQGLRKQDKYFCLLQWCGPSRVHYQEVLCRLCDAVRRTQPNLWATALGRLRVIKSFLAITPVLRQPPCFPDIVPCDFWLFLKKCLQKGPEKVSYKIRRTIYVPYQKWSSSYASESGKTVEKNMGYPKGTFLKGIRIQLYMRQKYMNKSVNCKMWIENTRSNCFYKLMLYDDL